MAKIIDYIALCVVVFVLCFVWSAYLFKGYVGALIFSSAMTAIMIFTIRYVRSKSAKPYTYERLALEFSLKGNEYIINLLTSILKNANIESGSNYILLDSSIIIAAFKFSSLTVSDMGAILSLAQKKDRRQVYVVCRNIDRRAYAVIQLERVRLTPIKIKTVYRFLKAHDALPDLRPVRTKFSVKAFLISAMSRANFKSYAFSGVLLVLISFITPLKIYYLVTGSLLLALAVCTLTPLGSGSVFSPKALSELERAICPDLSDPDANADDPAAEHTKRNDNVCNTDDSPDNATTPDTPDNAATPDSPDNDVTSADNSHNSADAPNSCHTDDAPASSTPNDIVGNKKP